MHGNVHIKKWEACSFLFLCYADSENERLNIAQRQAEGIAAAKERGVQFGASELPKPEKFTEAPKKWKSHWFSLRKDADYCGMAKSTF